MATTPGLMYKWPWEKLGNLKYAIYLPMAVKAINSNFLGGHDVDNACFHLLLVAALRYLLVQLWCTASRLPCISGKYRIQTKGIRFEQVDREAHWEHMIILNTLLIWAGHEFLPAYFANVPIWNTKGLVLAFIAHAGPVEFIYYWAHRALHHHFLYNRYHSHHHSSFVTEPATSTNHPFMEHILYASIYGVAVAVPFFLGYGSIGTLYIYLLWQDFMNVWGHCNFEFIPTWVFRIIPPLKYLVYTPSFHSLHHTHVHTNFSLYMPFYDYMYGTVDATTDRLYESVRKGRQEKVDCVYVTHATDLLSTFHFQFGFRSFAAHPYSAKWYIWLLWPVAFPVMLLAWLLGRPFVADQHGLNNLEIQTWVIPRFTFQYFFTFEKPRINRMIEDCIIEAQEKGAKVVALGLLNKDSDLNGSGELFVRINRNIRSVSVVNGSTLTVAIVVNEIPKGMKEVFLVGASTRIGRAIALYLSKSGIRVLAQVSSRDQFETLQNAASTESKHYLIHVSKHQYADFCKTWIVGEQISKREQKLAPAGTHFHQFTDFPIKKARKDCTYGFVPALRLPKTIRNLHACEDGMPRYVVHASHAAGIVQALEGLTDDEVGEIDIGSVDATWEAALKHGMRPFNLYEEST